MHGQKPWKEGGKTAVLDHLEGQLDVIITSGEIFVVSTYLENLKYKMDWKRNSFKRQLELSVYINVQINI
jgi:hypothetical protein